MSSTSETSSERGGDLVEEQQPRLHGQGPHDGHAPLLTTRQAVGVVARLVVEADADSNV